jgi:hypothetical protein
MGTRSLTYVMEGKNKLICMYRQMDGYPSGHGAALAEFLLPMNVINGMSATETLGRAANGMGCLAAQLVAHFKTDVGRIYMIPTAGLQDCGQEYEYYIHGNKIEVFESGYRDIDDRKESQIFSGSWEKFAEFCKTEGEAEA